MALHASCQKFELKSDGHKCSLKPLIFCQSQISIKKLFFLNIIKFLKNLFICSHQRKGYQISAVTGSKAAEEVQELRKE